MAEKYPGLKLVTIQPSDGDRDRAFAETQNVLKVYPQVKLIMAIAAPAVPAQPKPLSNQAARMSKSRGCRCRTCASLMFTRE